MSGEIGHMQNWSKSRIAHNKLLGLHLQPKPENLSNHLQSIAQIIADWKAECYIRPRLAHAHQTLREGQIMLARRSTLPFGYHTAPVDVQTLDPQGLQPHLFVLTDGDDEVTMLPYEYRFDTPRDLGQLHTEVFAALSKYVALHDVEDLIAFEMLDGLPASNRKMVEFGFDTCTLSVDSRGVPKAKDPEYHSDTAWTVEVIHGVVGYSGAETYYKEPGKDHETYKSESAGNVQELIEVLRQKGVWDDNLWRRSTESVTVAG